MSGRICIRQSRAHSTASWMAPKKAALLRKQNEDYHSFLRLAPLAPELQGRTHGSVRCAQLQFPLELSEALKSSGTPQLLTEREPCRLACRRSRTRSAQRSVMNDVLEAMRNVTEPAMQYRYVCKRLVWCSGTVCRTTCQQLQHHLRQRSRHKWPEAFQAAVFKRG